MPSWVDDVIWWHVYPLGFVGAPPEPAADAVVQHRLSRIEGWLDHAVELGASGLALGPVFASETHGYDTTDHLRIDPRLGDDGDFDALVAAAHARGLRVLLDGVFNHVGRGHPAYQAVLEHGPGAPTASWFRLTWPGDGSWTPGTEPDAEVFEGHGRLVELDHDEPAVADLVAEVMIHWLDRGADGWRLDAAYAVPPAFWRPVLERVRQAHPEAYVVGEVIHGDYAEIVAQSGMDAVTQYELWKATWSSIEERNFFELAWTLGRHNRFLDAFVPLTFLGNHDVTRIATRLTDARHHAHALVLLMTLGGTPSLYAGDEVGMRGTKEERAGGDDAVRPAFPAAPDGLDDADWAVYRLHQLLVGLRRRHRWLHGARTSTVHLTNEQLVVVTSAGDDRLVVALNLADEEVDLPVAGAATVLAGEAELLDSEGPERTARLAAHGWAVLAP